MDPFSEHLSSAVINAMDYFLTRNGFADRIAEHIFKHNRRWSPVEKEQFLETFYGIIRRKRLLSEISGIPDPGSKILFSAWCIINHLPDPESVLDKEEVLKRYSELRLIRKVYESVPDWIDELGCKELGDKKWDLELRALNQPPKLVLRINRLKSSYEEMRIKFEKENILIDKNTEAPDAVVLREWADVFQLPFFKDGLFEVQDSSSQQVAPFLQVQPGMRVVDACAGVGGKTLHLSALMKNRGKIIAMDTMEWKLEELRRRARRAGASNIEAKLIDSSKVIKRLAGTADRLLIDAPCSGTGVWKRNPDSKWRLTPESFEKIILLQKKILGDYSQILKKEGVLVYATCSIFRSESENQVADFITQSDGKFELMEEKRIWPSEGFDGFYMAVLKRK